MLGLVLLVFAFVFAAIGSRWSPPGWNFTALSLALYFLSLLVGHFPLR